MERSGIRRGAEMEKLISMSDSYKKVLTEEWKNLPEVAAEFGSRIFYPVTCSKDTVFHLAVYSFGEEPIKTFLASISEDVDEEAWRNNVLNTPLHEAAGIGNLAAVKLLVEFRKEDMLEKNFYGETPLYRAAKYGNLGVVEYFLDDCDDFFSRSSLNWTAGVEDDYTPIIHAAIQSENFDVVLKLVDFDKSLLEMVNSEEETGLHMLANMPHVFKSGCPMNLCQQAIYFLLPKEDIYTLDFENFNDNDLTSSHTKNKKIEDLEAGGNPKRYRHSNYWLYFLHCLKRLFWRFVIIGWPQWRELYRIKQKNEKAVRVVKMLANIDHSWYQSRQNPEIIFKVNTYEEQEDKKPADKEINYIDFHDTPLLLAAARGIIEVVEKIIEIHPQAIDYVTTHDRNILHVAIAHRQRTIFDYIKKKHLVKYKLAKRIDTIGFTLLHHVGLTKFIPQPTHGPALQLQQELKWYADVEKAVPSLYAMHHSKEQWKPREYFDETHKDMLESAKEWLKKTSESCSAVAVLIATVVFAAAFTVPGGLNSKTGTPILLEEPIYMVFMVMDIIGLTTSLASVVMFLSILTSSFKMDDFRHTLPIKLYLGFQFLFFSVASTMMAFALAVVLTMKSTKLKWAQSILYLATFFPVTMFIIIQLPLYVELVKNIWSYRNTIFDFFPIGFLSLLFYQLPRKFGCRKSA